MRYAYQAYKTDVGRIRRLRRIRHFTTLAVAKTLHSI